MITKEQAATIMADSANALRKLASRVSELEGENASLVRRMEAEKVAADMHDKGIHTEVPFDELATQMEKEAENGRLPVIQEALSMTGPDMFKGASLREGGEEGAAGQTELEHFILGTIG